MTSPGTDTAALGAIIARTRWLLLDFDGPICSIFSGLPAPTVAEKLRKLFLSDLLDEIANTPTRSRSSSTQRPSATNWPPASKPKWQT